MIRMAVCDDCQEDSKNLAADLVDVWENEAIVDEFETSDMLLREIDRGTVYGIVFIDIFLHENSGLEVAEVLKKKHPEISVVLISSSRDFGPEAFEINAFYYIVKPIHRDKLVQVKERFVEISKKAEFLQVKINGGQQEIPLYLVSYIESIHNNLLFHLSNGSEISSRGILREVEESLDERFLRINRGIIVNMEHIEMMDSEFCQIGEEKFSVSRSRRTECRRIYNEYLFSEAIGKRM